MMLPLLRRSTLSLACLCAAHLAVAAPMVNAVADPFDPQANTPTPQAVSPDQPLPLGDPAQMPRIKHGRNKEAISSEVAEGDGSTTPDLPIAVPAPPVDTWTADLINSATWTTDIGKGQYPVYAKAQILLDRSHSSTGAIDGMSGRNMLKAIAAFELMQGLPVDGVLDADVWDRLLQADNTPVMQAYTLTEADIKGPYAPTIPHDYAEQAKMKGLYYASVAEMLGERFHMDQTFLQQLNSGKNFNTVGEQIWVTDTGPEDTRPLTLLIAHKGASELYGFDENNQMIAAYPATIGSNDTPSPSGDVTIRAIAAKPWYGYNPKNFIQGKNMKPLSLPPGPNNPVGSMWIALSKPSYGIHGTPSPSKIDKTRSHGCVRLTNWDAEALAKRIKVGVPVQFRGTPR
jgi:lipoprotein-anchoring transpeptidase ErfK/SrfK